MGCPLGMLLAVLAGASPSVAVLSSRGGETELRFQPVGSQVLAPVVARLSHADGSSIAGAVIPGTRTVVVSALVTEGVDASFASALFRMDEGRPPTLLAPGLAGGSRPWVSAEGRIFVSRGQPGPVIEDGRIDALTIDEVQLDGQLRTVYRTAGYVTYLVGSYGHELVVYEVQPHTARLIAIHEDTGVVRPIVSKMVPLAHDFVLDVPRRRLLYTQGEPTARRWTVQSVDVSKGGVLSFVSGPEVTLIPTVFPDGRVAVHGHRGSGLIDVTSQERVLAPQGDGFERVRFFLNGLAFGLHECPSQFPQMFVIHLASGERVPLRTAPAARLELAGVVP